MLCRSLKRIAKDGTTVVLSIHQPRAEIFELFTQIVFLAKDGRVAYCGPPRGVLPYLQTELAPSLSVARPPLGKGNGSTGKAATAVNPADALLDLMAVSACAFLFDNFRASFHSCLCPCQCDMFFSDVDIIACYHE
jgi:ABC-type multidrug transport system ATPase subunit